ncbi:MAG: SPOR domain-containing protein [Burkholderiaceae bacterium]|nr:SPOR domain-containing protein [Burkholderiaceae bacterium]
MASRAKNAKSEGALDPALPQKKRARRRLVGAAAVCLAAAIVLPLVLDSEPRQIRDDVQVQIPSRDAPLAERATRNGVILPPGGSGPVTKPQSDARPEAVAKPDPETRPAPAAGPELPAKPEPVGKPELSARPEAAGKPEVSARPEPAGKPEVSAKPEPVPRPDSAARPDTAASSAAYAVQIGAFSSPKGASDQVERARRLGFRTYTEKIATAQGERTRVRVGPFPDREGAEAARARLRAAGLESTLVSPEK